MPFDIYTPNRCKTRFPEGIARIGKQGAVRFCGRDLERAGVGTSGVVLVDRGLGRVAIRKPREDDPQRAVIAVRWSLNRSSAKVQMYGALLAIGHDTKAAALGDQPAIVKEDRVEICLGVKPLKS